VADDSSEAGERREPTPALEDAGQGQGVRQLRQYVPAEILDVSFPVSLLGYRRQAVDAYVERVNRAIAELKISASPAAAVRHALDQAGEKVDSLLRAAREAGAEIIARAEQEAEQDASRARADAAELVVEASAEADRVRAEAEQLLATARAEADAIVAAATAEAKSTVERSQSEADERARQVEGELAALREQAETRMRALRADTDAIWQERRELLDSVGGIADSLLALTNTAASRLPSEREDEIAQAEAADETELPTVVEEPHRSASGDH
jgi:DivIVA domain-containing protein